ncbi:cytochrome c-type biogenesis protein [Stappia stellulata]|uniref:cytochrome c-type biogenesis protein n=1 Tax=Stappia stellulata TaxID=71235 RepID=UPI0004125EF2|nr:cytochrome c-type biogenesis protein [Stappia stellulata]
MRNAVLAILAALVLAVAALPAGAVAPDEILEDPALEQRARDLSANLRCMVCQNQSIDDSDAPLAKDLRVLVRERLVAGDTNGEVIDYLVARYGEFVLLKPRFSWNTLLLWAVAPLALLVGGATLFVAARRRTRTLATARTTTLSDTEQAELDRILAEGGDGR